MSYSAPNQTWTMENAREVDARIRALRAAEAAAPRALAEAARAAVDVLLLATGFFISLAAGIAAVLAFTGVLAF